MSEKEQADLEKQKLLEKNFFSTSDIGINPKNPNLPIVSLTSFGSRVDTVHLTIQSLFEQSQAPKKIVLWLDQEEFQSNNLPESLVRAQSRGLEVKFCKNIRSYKKIIPSLLAYPSDIIITVDDDILYPSFFIEELMNTHRDYKNSICCYRAHQITKNLDNEINPYQSWQHNISFTPPRMDLLATGAGGILYPPKCFSYDVLDEKTFMELCPTADDIWLKVAALQSDIPCVVVPKHSAWAALPPFILGTQEECLAKSNVKSENDIQLNRVLEHFGLKQKLLQLISEN